MSLARVARVSARRADEFRYALREFFQAVAEDRDPDLIRRAPSPTLRPEYDAYLAAVAEGVALYFRWESPGWVNASERVLRRPYFGNAPAGMRIPLLQESPAYFRKHNIFVDAGEVEDTLRKYEHGGT